MVILDTNIVIELFKNNQNIKQKIKDIGTKNLAISAISVGEFYYGALNKREMKLIKKHCNYYYVL